MRVAAAPDISVARQVLVLQVGVVLLLVVASIALAAYDARRDARDDATERAVAVAEAVADSPTVVCGRSPPPTRRPCCSRTPSRCRADTDVDFVVVMGLDRIRYTHPARPGIGKQFVGDLGDAPEGEVFTAGVHGHPRPVDARGGAGDRRRRTRSSRWSPSASRSRRSTSSCAATCGLILLAAAVVLGVGLLGAWLVSRRLRRLTHGMGEREIARMYEYYCAVLHAVREGLLLLDDDGRVQLVNDEARRLLDLPEDVIGRKVQDLGLPPGLVAAALGRAAESDDIYLAGDRILVVSSAPGDLAGPGGRCRGHPPRPHGAARR